MTAMSGESVIPPGSRAILIGVPRYQDPKLVSYDTVGNSVEGMRHLLVESGLCGWQKDQVSEFVDPTNSGQFLTELRELALGTSGVLLLYFVGHGLLSEQGELCLAIADTDHRNADATGLEYDKIRRMLRGGTTATTRIAIIDCCYSGRIVGLGSVDEKQLADLSETEGAYTLTAADGLAGSQGAPHNTFTAFSGELLDLLTHGIPDGPAKLTLGTIFPHLQRRLKARGLPRPNQRADGSAAAFVFARNAASTVSHAAPPAPPPTATTDAQPPPPGVTITSSAPATMHGGRSAAGRRPWTRRGGVVALVVLAAAAGIITWTQWPSAQPLPAFTEVETLAGQTTADRLAFSPDGRTLVAVDDGRRSSTVRLLNTSTRQPIGQPFTLSGYTAVSGLRFCPDGPTAVTDDNGSQSVVRLWNVLSHHEIRQPITIPHNSLFGALSPDCRTLATVDLGTRDVDTTSGGTHDTVRLWDVSSGQQIGGPVTVTASGDLTVVFTPDSHTLAVGYNFSNAPTNGLTAPGGEVDLWNVASGDPNGRFTYRSDTMSLEAVAFSPDSRTLATAYGGGGASTVLLWDLTSGEQIGQPIADPDNPFAATFIGSGRVLATEDRFTRNGIAHDIVRLWDVASQRQISQPLTGNVTAVAFSPDGRTLATANTDHTLQLWRLPPGG